MKKIELSFNDNLESIVYELLAVRARGERAYAIFGGHYLYSDSVDIDSAFLAVTGYIKSEYDRVMLENNLKDNNSKANKMVFDLGPHEDAQKRVKENMPRWIETGQSLIYPEKYGAWQRIVEHCSRSIFYGMEIEAALEIMIKLQSNCSYEEAEKLFNSQNHCTLSAETVRNIVFHFSNRGPQFIKKGFEIREYIISEEEKELIEEVEKANASFTKINVQVKPFEKSL